LGGRADLMRISKRFDFFSFQDLGPDVFVGCWNDGCASQVNLDLLRVLLTDLIFLGTDGNGSALGFRSS
jgi:hypothetical protein